MLSLDFIRANKKKVIEAAKNKNREVDIDKILKLDDERRELIQKIQTLREERNKTSHGKPDEKTIQRGREIKEELKKFEESLNITSVQLDKLVSFVPNVPLLEVPVGKDESGNVEVKKWGNSLGAIIDSKVSKKLGLKEGQKITISIETVQKLSGFGIAKGAKSFKRERDEHEF